MPAILLNSGSSQFDQFLQCYYGGQSCDLLIYCQGETGSIPCHRLILSTVSNWMKAYLGSMHQHEEVALILPAPCSLQQVRMFLNSLYEGLVTKQDIIFDNSLDVISNTLGLVRIAPKVEDTLYFEVVDFKTSLGEENFEDSEPTEEMTSEHNFLKGEEDFDFDMEQDVDAEDMDYDPQEEDNLPLAKSKKRMKPFKQKRRKQVKKGTLRKDKERDPEELAKISVLQEEAKFVIKDTTLEVLQDIPVQKYIPDFDFVNAHYFHAMCAVSMQEERLLAKPLCWTNPEESEYWAQFQTALTYFQTLCGFSEQELLQYTLVLPGKTLSKYRENESEKWTVKFAKQSKEESEKLLEQEKELIKKHEEKVGEARNLNKLSDNLDVIFTHELAKENCDNIVLLSWSQSGISIYPFLPCKGTECTQIVFEVWHNYEEFDLNKEVKAFYKNILDTYNRILALEKVLAPEEHLTCSQCDFTKKVVTKYDRRLFQNHVKNHKLEVLDCGCNLIFDTMLAKKRHMELVHSNLERVQCKQCNFVGTKYAMTVHVDRIHDVKNCACEICGEICRTSNDLKSHHNLKHKVYQCKVCNEEIIGYRALTTHRVNYHGRERKKKQSAICEECGYKSSSERALELHIMNQHTNNTDKPFQCQHCDKGFGEKNHMKRHMKTCSKRMENL